MAVHAFKKIPLGEQTTGNKICQKSKKCGPKFPLSTQINKKGLIFIKWLFVSMDEPNNSLLTAKTRFVTDLQLSKNGLRICILHFLHIHV